MAGSSDTGDAIGVAPGRRKANVRLAVALALLALGFYVLMFFVMPS